MGKGHDLGRWGEREAERYLTTRGWSVLARNFRDGPREIDLIVARDDTTAFVEVKTRAGTAEDLAGALAGISYRKRADLARAAGRWMRDRGPHRGPCGGTFRFDVVLIHAFPVGDPRVEHMPDAWRPGH